MISYYINEVKKKSKKLPGVALFSSIVIALMGYQIDKFSSNLTYVFLVYVLSVLFFFFSGIFDNVLFDSLFGINKSNPINKIFCKRLNSYRTKALVSINPNLMDFKLAESSKYPDTLKFVGLYATSKTILQANGSWNGTPKFLLDISKSSRSIFFLLLCLILLWLIKPNLLLHSNIENQESLFTSIKKYKFQFLILFLLIAQIFRYYHLVSVYKLMSKNNWNENIIRLQRGKDKITLNYLPIKHNLISINHLGVTKERKNYENIYEMMNNDRNENEIMQNYNESKYKVKAIIKTRKTSP